ncbi:MAG: ABC transporter ATP-binding protein [Candidatus Bathyarchaeia archaeon]
MKDAIKVRYLRKNFGRLEALKNVSFSVDEGAIYGLIGPNGAGKTTTLRIIGTLIKPTSGDVSIFGVDVIRNPDEARRIISYLPEEAGAYQYLSGYEYLRFIANFYAGKHNSVEDMVEEAEKISGLGARLKDRIKGYSKGMNRRLLLARALMIRPRLAILDEPTSGLDVIHAYHIRRMIKDYVEGHGVTVLLSSHNMLEVEYLCNRVALIDDGVVIAEGEPNILKEKFNADNLEQVFIEVARPG